MSSLRKSLWLKVTVIVILQSAITMLAVYFITARNFKKSVKWNLTRLESSILNEAKGDKDWQTLQKNVAFINNDEENNYSYAVFQQNTVLTSFGEETPQKAPAQRKLTITNIGYKTFLFEQTRIYKDTTIYTRAEANLDLIDDTLWIFAICLPLILLPVFYFGLRTSQQIVNPLRKAAHGLKMVEQGDLNTRIINDASNIEIKNLINSINSTFERLEESFSLATRFNANAAHELKTPLAILRGEIEVCLQKERNANDYEECLGKCLDEIFQLNKIVESLLLISKPDYQLNNKTIKLKELINKILETSHIIAAEKNTLISIELSDVMVDGDELLLERALHNLIDNAIKFSPESSTIKVTLAKENETIKISIADQAAPIPTEKVKLLFEPFFRLNSNEYGSGLGLALVKWVAEIHRGQIDIKSTASGNIFSLILPQKDIL